MRKLTYEEAREVYITQKTNPLELLVPNGGQRRWIHCVGRHVDGEKPRTKVFSAANKIGKTASTIAILASCMWGPQNKWFDYPVFRKWPFPKVCWIISRDSAIKEIIIPEMYKWFPRGRYKAIKDGKTFEYHWETDTGWKIFIKTYDQSPETFESALIGLCVFSEPPPEQIFNAIPARMSLGGLRLMEMTPLIEAAWIFDELIEDDKAEVIYADLEDNCREHGRRGRLKHSDIDLMIRDYDFEQIEARAHGRFVHLTGRVFKIFNENVHIVDRRPVMQGEQVWFTMDPHDAKPPFCQWWAVSSTNDFRCIMEYPAYEPRRGYETVKETNLTISEHAEVILEIEKDFNYKPVRRIMDRYFGAKAYGNTQRTVQQTYADAGIRCSLAPDANVEHGHAEIRELLKYDQGNPGRKPKIVWEEHCENSIRAMRHYKYIDPRKRKDEDDVASVRRKLTEKWKHPADTCRIFVESKPGYDHTIKQENSPWKWQEVGKPKSGGFDPMAN